MWYVTKTMNRRRLNEVKRNEITALLILASETSFRSCLSWSRNLCLPYRVEVGHGLEAPSLKRNHFKYRQESQTSIPHHRERTAKVSAVKKLLSCGKCSNGGFQHVIVTESGLKASGELSVLESSPISETQPTFPAFVEAGLSVKYFCLHCDAPATVLLLRYVASCHEKTLFKTRGLSHPGYDGITPACSRTASRPVVEINLSPA